MINVSGFSGNHYVEGSKNGEDGVQSTTPTEWGRWTGNDSPSRDEVRGGTPDLDVDSVSPTVYFLIYVLTYLLTCTKPLLNSSDLKTNSHFCS